MVKIKRFIITILITVLTVTLAMPTSYADKIIRRYVRLIVNGYELIPDVPPVIIDNRVMVPYRFAEEIFGYTDAEWDEEKRVVLIDSSSINDTAVPPVSSKEDPIRIYVAGKEIYSEVPAQKIEGRIMVPLRSVAEALGAEIGWDAETYTVTIDKTEEKYGFKREIKKWGKVVVTLEPDELYIVTSSNSIYRMGTQEETLHKLLGQYIEKYFPDVKFKIYDWDVANEEDWATSGVYPDIYIDLPERNTIRHIKKYGMEYDLTYFL